MTRPGAFCLISSATSLSCLGFIKENRNVNFSGNWDKDINNIRTESFLRILDKLQEEEDRRRDGIRTKAGSITPTAVALEMTHV